MVLIYSTCGGLCEKSPAVFYQVMKRFLKIGVVVGFVPCLCAEDADGVPLGVDFIFGARSDFYVQGLHLADSVNEFQLSSGVRVTDELGVAFGGWQVSGMDSEFAEAGGYLDVFYSLDSWECGVTTAYQQLSNSVYASGLELGLMAGWFDAGHYVGAEWVYDDAFSGHYLESNYSYQTEGFLGVHQWEVATSWVSSYAGHSSFHDVRIGWSCDTELKPHWVMTPNLEQVFALSETAKDSLFWGGVTMSITF